MTTWTGTEGDRSHTLGDITHYALGGPAWTSPSASRRSSKPTRTCASKAPA